MKSKKPLSPLLAFGTATALVLSGCAGGNDAPVDDTSSAPADDTKTTDSPNSTGDAPRAEELPVGEPFEEPSWSIEETEGTVEVTPDRLVSIKGASIRAWSPDGEEAWTYEAPETPRDVQVLNETVAVMTEGSSEGEGLDKTQQVVNVTLISLKDGNVDSEVEVPDSEISSHGLTFKPRSDENVDLANPNHLSFIQLTEDGKTREVNEGFAEKINAVNGVPVWSNGSELQTEKWNARDLGLGASGVKLIDDGGALLLLSDTSGSRKDNKTLSMVKAETGKTLYTVSCPTDQYGWGASGGNSGNVAINSPNGEYAVAARLLFSDTESKCVGGGKQQSVTLTAVDDNGTAYGETEENKLVVVSFDGEPEVSPLSESASAPIGVMNGNIAIHWDKGTGVVTGNPIKGE